MNKTNEEDISHEKLISNIIISLDQITRQKIFGTSSSENEEIEYATKAYYLTQKVRQAESKVRNGFAIITGDKGIGKSTLLRRVAYNLCNEDSRHISLRADDLINEEAIDSNTNALATMTKQYKNIISIQAYKKGFESKKNQKDKTAWILNKLFNGIEIIESIFKKYGIDPDEVKKTIGDATSTNQRVCIFIDEYDRGWSGSKGEINRLAALIYAAVDMHADSNKAICFAFAIKSDIYDRLIHLHTELKSRIEDFLIRLEWQNNEIIAAMVKRIDLYFNTLLSDDVEYLNIASKKLWKSKIKRIMDPLFKIKWHNTPNKSIETHRFLLALIRKRPRDLIKLLNLSGEDAYRYNSTIIKNESFLHVLSEYSSEIYSDLISEHSFEMPQIRKILDLLLAKSIHKKNIIGYSSDKELEKKITEILESNECALYGENARCATVFEYLYKIEFIEAKPNQALRGQKVKRYNVPNRFIYSDVRNSDCEWQIHPAFWWIASAGEGNRILRYLEFPRNIQKR